MDKQQLEAIRARDANAYPTPPIANETYLQQAQRDRHALLAAYDDLAAELLTLKEHCAALESREVCTVAHDNVETCGYCQRDRLAAAARKALLLLEYADDSDDCQYGTISTGTVRELLADLRALLGGK